MSIALNHIIHMMLGLINEIPPESCNCKTTTQIKGRSLDAICNLTPDREASKQPDVSSSMSGDLKLHSFHSQWRFLFPWNLSGVLQHEGICYLLNSAYLDSDHE